MELAPVTKKIVAFGSKQVFLPKFTIALIRTPRLSPYHAKFLVPLNFSKYDLRDYLYHAYSVKVHSVRSLVQLMPVRDTTKQPRHWFREDSKKYMTVEMEKPFVWPEAPESLDPWGHREKIRNNRDSQEAQGVKSKEAQRKRAEGLRRQALELLGAPEKVVKGAKVEKEEERKRKLLETTPLKKWRARRTPLILGQDQVKTNFSSLMRFRNQDDEARV